jgi:hypothetical protein
VRDLAAIDAILQHEIEGPAGELVTAIDSPVREGAVFATDSHSIEFSFEGTHRPEFDVTPEYMKDGRCLLFIDDELPVPDIVGPAPGSSQPKAILA